MTGSAGRRAQVLCMTGTAGSSAMVDSRAAFVRNTGMRSVIGGEPIVRCMAFGAVRAEHTGMECGVAVTANTSRG